jgi:acetyl-CoA synthetase
MIMTTTYFSPPADVREQSNLKAFLKEFGFDDYNALLDRSNSDPRWFWDTILKWYGVVFDKPYDDICDDQDGPQFMKWCVGGELNLVNSCFERHMDSDRWEKTALIAIDETGAQREWRYKDYFEESCKVANFLKSKGIGKGDAVAIYMPMIPEMAAAFMAIARLGAIAIPLFSGFAANAIAIRLDDAQVKAVVTATSTSRGGKKVDMAAALVEAIETVPSVENVLCLVRDGDTLPSHDRLTSWKEGIQHFSGSCPAVSLTPEDPLFVAFTSGTTGKPKGVVQNHIGILAKIITDFVLCLDLKETDRHMWMTDMGWVMGPLTLISTALTGSTLVLAEGAPTLASAPFRMLNLVDELKISHMGIAPTVARQLMTLDPKLLSKLSLDSLRIVPSTGEAWTHDAWIWTRDNVCKNKAVPLNMSGGTELVGAILTSTVMQDIPPCGFSTENPGVGAQVFTPDGAEASIGNVGELVMTHAPMGITLGLWKDNDRYLKTYWSTFKDVWHHGDWAHKNEDGTWHIHGRSDDTINVAGKRVGPPEIEGALTESLLVADAAAIAVPDDLKGVGVVCFCVLRKGTNPSRELIAELRQLVGEKVGKPFVPKHIYFAADLPKTRSMKIMRRVIRATYLQEETGDLSSLSNPESVIAVRDAVLKLNPK